ncbi:ubiquitin carboxyl-terminal hydrolase 38 [Acomys russatus]|uniref:ubiquitin carboxyl-terminal hydrolase 38 n=1 Tax=Acomys russatus TaxID=60746 RepID=UPI0021E31FF4|nr:ubiquitin carboxyl-terminal hydrolase 38 [Acomys russatus]
MDKILEGLVSSSHPLPLKRMIVRKVVESAEHWLDEAQCEAMFDLTTRLILEGQDHFQRQVGHQVLEAYARYHRPEFESFFNKTFVLGLLQQGYHSLDRKDVAILDYIHNGLKLIMSCPSVLDLFSLLQVEVLRVVCERPEPQLCARLSDLLTDFVQCVPKGKLSITFCQQLVRTIGHFQCVSTQEKELREYVSQVTKVSNLLQSIWKAEPSTLLPSLQEVFASISSTDASFEPSVALASLVQHIPLQMITVLIRSLTTDPNVRDASMTHALCRMIDWLSWPLAQHVDTWVIALLKGLAAVQKFTILIDVTLLKIELVFNRLWFPLVRPGALAVLSHMLLSFQHSPEAFHSIVPHVVNLVHSFKSDGLPSSTAFLVQVTELVHCMMYHYSGFPDLYDPILEAIKDFPKPSEEKIKLTLNQSAWTSQSNALASCLSRLSGKSETGKTGLINLGNTCYMNSVLQALFMATDFRRQVLSLNLNGCNSLMKKLQHLFAFLAHTQREAYAPRIFFEASRPPWFTPRSQQDCSEYLRFLLDRLHEEEKILRVEASHKPPEGLGCSGTSLQDVTGKVAVPTTASPSTGDVGEKTLIEKMFGGKLRTHVCCLNCRSTSQKVEAFTDLSLAFCPSPSVEDLSFQDPASLPGAHDDGLMQTSVADPEEEEPVVYNPATAAFVCDSVVNPRLLGSPVEFHCAENTSVPGESAELLISKDVPQNPGGESTPSVADLLNYFLAPEILTGDNQYYCENCASLQNAEKTMQVTEEPEYLILTLLRFSYDQKYHVRRKILDNVSLPLVLELPVKRTASFTSLSESWSVDVDFTDLNENLAKKLKPSGAEEALCPKLVPYLLSSVVVHSGVSSESGHYYSYARNIAGTGSSQQMCPQSESLAVARSQSCLLGGESPSAVTEQDSENKEMSQEWFLFNDSRVTFTSFQSVQKITSRFPKDTAYVLLYKKQSSTNGLRSDNPASGVWVSGDPPLQKELMDAITKDNKLYLQEQELNARARALQAASASCSFRPNGFDDNDPPGSCGPTGGGGGGGFNTVGRLVF